MVIDKNFFISLAITEAWKYQGLTYPNPAVGCVVVGKNNEILAIEAHKRAGYPHAEVEALKTAYIKLTNDTKILDCISSSDIHKYLLQNHNSVFKHVDIYTTLEPCSHKGKTPSCATLLSSLGVKKVYIGSQDTNPIASCGADRLLASGIDVESGVMQKECDELLFPFKRWSEKNFIFFKWAQRLNGTTDGGIITSKDSRTSVHAMRNICDLLVIGGGTVREDRPTLDARLVDGKAPDILIISREKEFDKNIPLFSVKNRKVFISSDFSICDNYNNIMIEGGSGMFQLSKKYIDMYLCYISAKFGGNQKIDGYDEKFDILNIQKESQDIIMWMKRK